MEVFGTLGKLFSGAKAGPILSGGAMGLGELGNLLAGRQTSQEASKLQAQQDKISGLTPAQLTQMITSAEKPIDNALVQNVTNTVQGDMASRGLSQAPGIFAAGESQALAPYAQQNYQVALEQVMRQLGLPLEYANTIKQFLPQQQNMTPAMMLFLQQLSKLKGTNASTPTTGPNLDQLGTPPIFGDAGTTDGTTTALNGLLTQAA